MGYPPGMSRNPDPADDLAARAAANERRSRELAGEVSQVAGDIAETERRVATSFERVAADIPDRAHILLAKAQHAREFAEHERTEQRRWREVAGDQTQTR